LTYKSKRNVVHDECLRIKIEELGNIRQEFEKSMQKIVISIIENDQLRELQKSMQDQLTNLQMQIEIQTSRYHDILNIVLGKATRINNNIELKNTK
jgi:hypothetical protein